MKLLPLIVMVLVAYDTRGCTPSADDMAGAGKISTTFSENAKIEVGFVADTFAEQFPGGVKEFKTSTTFVFERTRQSETAAEQIFAVQFCRLGKNPEPIMVMVEPAYALRGLDALYNRMAGRRAQDSFAPVCTTNDVFGKVIEMFKIHGAVGSSKVSFVTMTVLLVDITSQRNAKCPHVLALHGPTTKLEPETVIVEPKYGGSGDTGTRSLICGSTILTALEETTKSRGFPKET
jgi:hypothetical protein